MKKFQMIEFFSSEQKLGLVIVQLTPRFFHYISNMSMNLLKVQKTKIKLSNSLMLYKRNVK